MDKVVFCNSADTVVIFSSGPDWNFPLLTVVKKYSQISKKLLCRRSNPPSWGWIVKIYPQYLILFLNSAGAYALGKKQPV